jgi:hypothetical protein
MKHSSEGWRPYNDQRQNAEDYTLLKSLPLAMEAIINAKALCSSLLA